MNEHDWSAGTKPPRRRLLLESHLASDARYGSDIGSETGAKSYSKIISPIGTKSVLAQIRA
jgi:hypothetical protein